MTIKTCTKEDITVLMRVLKQSYEENYTYLWFDNGEWYVEANFNFGRLNNELSDPNSAFFLVYDEQKPVGVIKLNIDSATGSLPAEKALELERIYFIKEASGKGLGKEAMNFIIDFARHRNKSMIWLKAMDSSAAVEFYKKRGYQINGETWLSFSQMKDEFKRMFVMVLHL